MTPRARLYFKFKSSFRLTTTATGRAKLAGLGVHPMGLTANWPSNTPAVFADGYFIDKKGNILGTTENRPRTPKTMYVNLPDISPTTYELKFQFASPDVLKELI